MPKTRRHKKDDAASQDEDLTHRVVELVTADMATRMDSFEARMEATMASLLVGLHPSPPLATRPDTPKVETTAPTVQGVSEHSHLRLSSAYPPPEKLTDALTYGQFIDWRGQMENYLTFTGLSTCPPQQQISFMLSRLTQEVNDTVRIVLALDPFQSSVAELLAKLAGHYRKKDNCRIRRSTFMKRQQADREPFSVFYREKLKLYHLTDPCTHCHDRTIGDFLIEGLFDSEIRRKCRALDESESELVVFVGFSFGQQSLPHVQFQMEAVAHLLVLCGLRQRQCHPRISSVKCSNAYRISSVKCSNAYRISSVKCLS